MSTTISLPSTFLRGQLTNVISVGKLLKSLQSSLLIDISHSQGLPDELPGKDIICIIYEGKKQKRAPRGDRTRNLVVVCLRATRSTDWASEAMCSVMTSLIIFLYIYNIHHSLDGRWFPVWGKPAICGLGSLKAPVSRLSFRLVMTWMKPSVTANLMTYQ